jgi:glycosyltransferase involved in cell wall biosynthesis
MDYKYQITVGMPVWGVEKYIRRSLISVLEQNFENMEILVIDDCGTDKSIEIATELAHSHPQGHKIRIIRQPHNMGCWAARNRVLDEAQGKYIFLIDSDDYLFDNAIPKLYQKAEETQVEATYGSVLPVDEHGHPIENSGVDGINLSDMVLKGEDQLASFANDNTKRLRLNNFIWNIMIRSDFLKKHQLRFRKTKFWDDVLFNADMQPLITSAALISDLTYHYVIRDNSLSNFQKRDVIQSEEVRQYINNQEYLKKQCLSLKGKNYFETRMTKMMRAMFYAIIGALRNESQLSEPIPYKEFRNAIRHPLSWKELIKFKKHKTINLVFWLLGELSPSLSVAIIKIIGKSRRLI